MASTYLTKTNSGAGTTTKGTFSAWIKISSIGDDNILFREYESSGNYFSIKLKSGGIEVYGQASSSAFVNVKTTRVLRDFSGWYHVLVAIDSTQSTESNRIKIYINGVQETTLSSTTYPSSSANCKINQNSEVQTIGGYGSAEYFDGSLSHVHWVDATAYPASTFGSTDSVTGEWKINTSPSVTYGTNGFFILKDGNTITDSSPNSNNFSLGGGTLTKTEDCPSNVFATLNPLDVDTGSSNTFSNGNLSLVTNGNGSRSTLAANSGKFYAEVKMSTNGVMNGVQDMSKPITANTGTVLLLPSGATLYVAGSTTSYGSAWSANDIMQIAMDLDSGTKKVYFGKDGQWWNGSAFANATPHTGTTLSDDTFYGFRCDSGVATPTSDWNFGNGFFGTTAISSEGTNASGIGKFEYDVPAGYTALSTKGLNE